MLGEEFCAPTFHSLSGFVPGAITAVGNKSEKSVTFLISVVLKKNVIII